MTFVLKVENLNEIVTCCGDCPRNISVKNKLTSMFPPSHHCKDTPDMMFPEGKLILNPNTIPAWCPHVPA